MPKWGVRNIEYRDITFYDTVSILKNTSRKFLIKSLHAMICGRQWLTLCCVWIKFDCMKTLKTLTAYGGVFFML